MIIIIIIIMVITIIEHKINEYHFNLFRQIVDLDHFHVLHTALTTELSSHLRKHWIYAPMAFSPRKR